jgi:CRISPR/Cas system-associated protein Cas7 (RAMP superfamily)
MQYNRAVDEAIEMKKEEIDNLIKTLSEKEKQYLLMRLMSVCFNELIEKEFDIEGK